MGEKSVLILVVCVFCFGIFMGSMIPSTFEKKVSTMKLECEKTLPRNQYCEPRVEFDIVTR